MARIAIGGFQHETNTFAPVKATYRDFEMADGWPGLTRGDAILTAFDGINLPIAGFIAEARKQGHELLPTLWCSASPSAEVEIDAYERIAGELLERIGKLDKIDGIYLDLHGAMVTEHEQDGEGELLERLRKQVGPDLPIVVSLDLHANVTERMVEHASALVVCRTYPHVDLAESGEASAAVLDRLIAAGAAVQGDAARGIPGAADLAMHADRAGAGPLSRRGGSGGRRHRKRILRLRLSAGGHRGMRPGHRHLCDDAARGGRGGGSPDRAW